jgi:antitoxin VapB
MPLNIRSKQADELAAALAKLTGETKTEAVTLALRERIDRVRQARSRRRLADELEDPRTADEILGYDEYGIPR